MLKKIDLKDKHRGAHNELIATVWLLRHGYDVFRNVSKSGLIDIVAIKDGETVFFDVKSSLIRSDGSRFLQRLSEEQVALNVKVINVYPDGECFIDMGPASPNKTPRPCKVCGVIFTPVWRSNQIYCTPKCVSKYSNEKWRRKMGS